LLIVALSFQFSVKVGIMGYYLANKDYIAKVLCINRDKPAMKCEGKCHLRGQLEQQEEQQQKNPASIKDMSETVIFINAPLTVSNRLLLPSSASDNTPYTFSVAAGYITAVFHPPSFAA
jgi:hypothetical protein